jgi:energy-coupling factor transporter ATP-binding protein EcfA2
MIGRVAAITESWGRAKKGIEAYQMAQAHMVVGNGPRGAGQSTVAAHRATALPHERAGVVTIDPDVRQPTMGHFFANRSALSAAHRARSPEPLAVVDVTGAAVRLEVRMVLRGRNLADVADPAVSK